MAYDGGPWLWKEWTVLSASGISRVWYLGYCCSLIICSRGVNLWVSYDSNLIQNWLIQNNSRFKTYSLLNESKRGHNIRSITPVYCSRKNQQYKTLGRCRVSEVRQTEHQVIFINWFKLLNSAFSFTEQQNTGIAFVFLFAFWCVMSNKFFFI